MNKFAYVAYICNLHKMSTVTIKQAFQHPHLQQGE